MAAAVALSGGSAADPPIPRGLPGPVPAFLGTEAKERGGATLRSDRRWLSLSRPLRADAPSWARRMYARSLLVLRATIDPRTGAAVAGARPGWAYVWPRDAGAAAIALAAAGYRREARQIARFLLRLDLGAAARFRRSGAPVEGREAQGDAGGWTAAAACAAGSIGADSSLAACEKGLPPQPSLWRDRADYQEKGSGEYLGNAIASGVDPHRIRAMFGIGRGLVRRAGDPSSGLDTAAAWAVRPFPQPLLFPPARRTLLRLAADGGRFGLAPSEAWDGGEDPWTAPTAWTAWSLAALGERRAALQLIASLRRASTRRGLLPERVDARTGAPRSTTPLAWSHAFAILALRELWPGPRR
jgi:Glycosyl hydrolases family 15